MSTHVAIVPTCVEIRGPVDTRAPAPPSSGSGLPKVNVVENSDSNNSSGGESSISSRSCSCCDDGLSPKSGDISPTYSSSDGGDFSDVSVEDGLPKFDHRCVARLFVFTVCLWFYVLATVAFPTPCWLIPRWQPRPSRSLSSRARGRGIDVTLVFV